MLARLPPPLRGGGERGKPRACVYLTCTTVARPSRRATHPTRCQAPQSKIFRFTGILNYGKKQPARAAMRGASRSSRNVARVAMDARGVRHVRMSDENAESVRRNRVVLAPRPWRLSAPAFLGCGNGDKQRRSPGRARISRKAIARGRPGCLGCTCQTRVLSLSTHCTRRCGRSQRSAFPAPSVHKRANEFAKPRTKSCRENEIACPSRHCERSEAIQLCRSKKAGLPRRYAPRNDGGSCLKTESANSLSPRRRPGPITTSVCG